MSSTSSHQNEGNQNESAQISNRARYYTLFVLVLIYASSHVDRYIVGILAESIKLDLGISDTQLGVLIGLTFAIFYAGLGIPVALMADRMNRRNIIAAAVVIWSGMTALCGLAQNYWQLLLARTGVGVGEAGSSPPSHSMISDLFPLEQRGAAMGFYSAGINIGILVGFAVGGYIDETYGWRIAFFVVGIPGILLGALLMLTVKEPPRTQIAKPLAGDTRAEKTANMFAEIWDTFKLMMAVPALRHVVLGCTLVVFVGYGTTNWNGVYLRRVLEMGSSDAGLALALIGGIIGGIGTFCGGWWADILGRKDRRAYVWLTAAVKTLLMPFIIAFYFATTVNTALYLLMILSFFGGFYLSASFAMTQALLPPERRALGAAILLFCINILGLGLGPVLVGIISDGLEGSYGVDSLRYALAIVACLNIWGSIHYYIASKTLREDLEAVAAA